MYFFLLFYVVISRKLFPINIILLLVDHCIKFSSGKSLLGSLFNCEDIDSKEKGCSGEEAERVQNLIFVSGDFCKCSSSTDCAVVGSPNSLDSGNTLGEYL